MKQIRRNTKALSLISSENLSISILSERKLRNRNQKMKNGNIRNQIKISLWNKGSSNIRNKIDEIRDIIKEKT